MAKAFASERLRLLGALGELTAGGIIEGIQPIGATSVPGMLAKPCVDIGLAVWPFPLEARHHATLNSLGYTPVADYEGAPEQRFHHATGNFQLFLAEPGSDEWTNYLLIRDYLRNTESARQIFSLSKQSHQADEPEYQQIKARLFSEMLAAARAWWISTQGFAPVEAVAQELKEFERPWHISSGWAMDLFLGRVTRVHHDVDIAIDRTDQAALQQYLSQRGWKMVTPFEGRLEPWPPHMLLRAAPPSSPRPSRWSIYRLSAQRSGKRAVALPARSRRGPPTRSSGLAHGAGDSLSGARARLVI